MFVYIIQAHTYRHTHASKHTHTHTHTQHTHTYRHMQVHTHTHTYILKFNITQTHKDIFLWTHKKGVKLEMINTIHRDRVGKAYQPF